ncbi:hypothetical protein C6P40_004965 [Pichia californica]|uniref:Deacetylase sirtuin-type domain-containing protein n=1 Tax=Pichia californica TaxID=460514 RepID=A0A9P6WNQ3_9ASCO|nr:hypothetical protein C6P40_004965 [[Candida] californica]
MPKVLSRNDSANKNAFPKISKILLKDGCKNILKDSNKINKKQLTTNTTATTTTKSIKLKLNNSKQIRKPKQPKLPKIKLQLNQSSIVNSIELREKISKLANVEDKGLKYLTFQEFEQLEEINNLITNSINKSKKMIILTGAGISCNAGIPDFRSNDGLYNKKLKKENENNKKIIKGKEMFDISVYRSIETINIFNNFIYDLYKQVSYSKPTLTHEFIKKLQDKNKLIKCYTQNIDGLERDCGLSTEFNCNEWNNTNVIQLHGDLHQLCCNSCKKNYRWDQIYDKEGNIIINQREINDVFYNCNELNEMNETDIENDDLMILSQNTNVSVDSINSTFSTTGDLDNKSISSICDTRTNESYDNDYNLIECPNCIENYESRIKLGKRSLESSIGIIRPNIVLYGEEHPYSETFAKNLNKDLNKKPNLLLIFGTSLKVNGVKNLVRKMSNKIHENEKGLVILINKDPVSLSGWKNYIDYQIVSDCDAFCGFVESRLPNVFCQV